MPYIEFTDDQKRRAASVDLEMFLENQGEKLLSSGSEKRLASNHSVTIRRNEWYDHATKEGGGPISFVQKFYDLSYPEAMTRLLNGEQSEPRFAPPKQKEKKGFCLPPRSDTMRRVYAYLLKQRLIDRRVLDAFVHNRLIYESREITKTGNEYHNAVFVGLDKNGVPRHAHKRSPNSIGKTFRMNIEGSDPRYSFHYVGTSDRLYTFEAPIDLLSFLTLYQKGWRVHSYAALCGTSEHVMVQMLEQNPNIKHIFLCLDHDEAGIEAAGRLTELLHKRGYTSVTVLQPEYKDWNEDIKAAHDLPALPAEEHPQLIVAPDVCQFITEKANTVKLDSLERDLSGLLQSYPIHMHWGRIGKAIDCAEQASALALAAYSRELRQLGKPVTDEELAKRMCRRIMPHQNNSVLKNRHRELGVKLQSVLALRKTPGIQSMEDKSRMAKAWLDLAADFAKVSVKYEADELKKWQKLKEGKIQTMTMS